MSEPSIADQREALRSAITVVQLIAREDFDSLARHVMTLDSFELETLIGCLGRFAVVGIHSLAALGGMSFDEQVKQLETFMVESVDGD